MMQAYRIWTDGMRRRGGEETIGEIRHYICTYRQESFSWNTGRKRGVGEERALSEIQRKEI